MPFKRFAEIGRVAMVNFGSRYGELVVISDIVDQNMALVDAPNAIRRAMNFKRLALTRFKIDIPRQARKATLIKALEASEVEKKFAESSWGQRLARRKDAAARSDFDRFMGARRYAEKKKKVSAALKKLRK